MPELSTLLRQRLRATEDRKSQHPDPDTLNAYMEELLSSGERDQVLQHLSVCSQCREVISLALPETISTVSAEVQAPGSTVTGISPLRRWFTSPAFGLAGSLAATILGVALLLHLSPGAHLREARQVQQPAQQANASVSPTANENTPSAARVAVTPPASVTADGQPTALVSSSPVGTASISNQDSVHSDRAALPAARKRATTPTNVPVVVADLRRDYINKTFLANSYETQVPTRYRDLPQAPAPAQANMTFAAPAVVAGNSFPGSSAFQIPANPAGANRGVLTLYSSETVNGRSTTLLGKIVDLGKRPLTRRLAPPIPSSSLGKSAMFQPGMPVGQGSNDAVAAKPEAAMEGSLAGSQAFSSRALGASGVKPLGGSQYQWKVVQGKLLRSSDLSHWSEENPRSENLKFSVVSANGSEIWAGGSDAALVHSPDGGATWERVTLGAAATGAITSIEVAGQNLLVKSSSGQVWNSQDGGKSWTVVE
jgi:hypothetical protein